MNFVLLTEPLQQNVLGKSPFSINAVRGRIFEVDVTLEDTNIQASFFFDFLDDKGVSVNQVNANRNSVFSGVLKSLPETLDEETKKSKANETTDKILKAILAGSKKERYEAMSLFSKAYGVTLLPLEQQVGRQEVTVVTPVLPGPPVETPTVTQ